MRSLAVWTAAAVILLASAEDPDPGASPCPACQKMRQKMRSMSLDAIKESILRKLGMKHFPNVTGREIPDIPPLDDISLLQGDQPFKPGPSYVEERDDYSATTEKVFVFAQAHPRLRHDRDKDILYFKFPEKVLENRVLKAKLWLYLKRSSEEEYVDVSVYKVNRIPNNSDNPVFRPETNSRPQREKRPVNEPGRWITIDVLEIVSEWIKIPRENLGLVVDTKVPGRDLRTQHLIVLPNQPPTSKERPFLEVQTANGRRHRTKRTIGLNCSENSNETRCCRYPLTVDFEEFGWDWVIAPKRYEANYCSGDCQPVFLPSYPHTHIVYISTLPNAAGMCCAPRKMSAISMLYFDHQSNIIYGVIPDLVVERCGCS